LAAIAGDGNRPRKYVERARIVRALADRQPGRRRASASAGQKDPQVWQGADRVIDEPEEVGG
jgi:hypothetical protein